MANPFNRVFLAARVESARLHCQHVEAHGHAREIRAQLQELGRRVDDAPLFRGADACGGAAVAVAAAQTNLDDDQYAAMLGDQIEFAATAAKVL